MNTTCQSRVLGLLRRAMRPSAVVRLLWLAVVVLHMGLVARRMAAGELNGVLDLLRGVLCLGGVIYGSLKFWRIATLLDSAPRRALAFALVLLLGHGLLASPASPAAAVDAPSVAVAVLIVTPVLGLMLLLASGAAPALFRSQAKTRVFVPVYATRPALHAAPARAFFLFRRPPPFSR